MSEPRDTPDDQGTPADGSVAGSKHSDSPDFKVKLAGKFNREEVDKMFSLKVNNVWEADKEDLHKLFDEFGAVADIHIPWDHGRFQPDGRPVLKGYAFIRFVEKEVAEKVLAEFPKSGRQLHGKDVGLQWVEPYPKKKPFQKFENNRRSFYDQRPRNERPGGYDRGPGYRGDRSFDRPPPRDFRRDYDGPRDRGYPPRDFNDRPPRDFQPRERGFDNRDYGYAPKRKFNPGFPEDVNRDTRYAPREFNDRPPVPYQNDRYPPGDNFQGARGDFDGKRRRYDGRDEPPMVRNAGAPDYQQDRNGYQNKQGGYRSYQDEPRKFN